MRRVAELLFGGEEMNNWQSVDTQAELDDLAARVCWEDSETQEIYATPANLDYYPSDVSRSGYRLMNVHVLINADSSVAPFLELAFVDCDRTNIHFLTHLFVKGRIDGLKRVELEDGKGQAVLRCSRLIFRFLSESQEMWSGHYFRNQGDAEP